MKAAFFRTHGGPDVLEYGDVEDPKMGPADVRVQVKAASLNHLDLFVRNGWPGLKLPMPHVGGTDVAGIVAEVGSDVKGVREGDEVLVNPGLNFEADPVHGEQVVPAEVHIVGETRWGGLAEQCVVPASHVVKKPAGMSWEQAASVPLTSITAMQMVRRKAKVRKGERVLVVGGGGGVALMALQLAKEAGAWVCATTGQDEKAARLRELGADHVINYRTSPDWSKEAFVATGKKGFDVVLDSAGTATFSKSVRLLGLGGRLVTCGATTGPMAEIDIRNIFWKQLSILGSTMGVPADLDEALRLWAHGKLKIMVDSVHPLADVRRAMARMEHSEQFGKIVLVP